MLITNDNLDLINQLMQLLDSVFHVKDLGELRYFLGIEVANSSKGIFLSQRTYVLDLLHETKMANAKPFNLPIEVHLKLASTTSCLFELDQYQRLIGKLI